MKALHFGTLVRPVFEHWLFDIYWRERLSGMFEPEGACALTGE
jgi:hypothetical protein